MVYKRILSLLTLIFLMNSCGKINFNPMSSSSFALSGVIEPIQSTEVVSSGFLISSAYASINCSNNIYVRLHKISPDGSLISDPVASTRVQGKSYGFESGELPNDIEAQGVGYQL